MSNGIWKFAAVSVVCASFALPAMAVQADLDTVRKECGVQLNFSPAGCQCMVDAAGTQLNDVQQAFVAAQITKNTARIGQIQGQMTMDQMLQVATFMTKVPQVCGSM